MRNELNFWVVGGDMRQAKLAELLSADGHTVHTYALEELGPLAGVHAAEDLGEAELADCVVLPLPAAGEGGRLNAPLSGAAHPMEELPITLHGARVLVIGYGRLGRALAPRLSALGARVSVAARKYAALAWAESFNWGTERIGQLAGWLCGYDLVVNTVPAPVLGEAELEELKPDCLVIDLASKPGGVDFAAAARLGRKVVWALSLPGKTAPVTAGRAIQTAIYNILSELGG